MVIVELGVAWLEHLIEQVVSISTTWSASLSAVVRGAPMVPVDTGGVMSGATLMTPLGLVKQVAADTTREAMSMGTKPDVEQVVCAMVQNAPVAGVPSEFVADEADAAAAGIDATMGEDATGIAVDVEMPMEIGAVSTRTGVAGAVETTNAEVGEEVRPKQHGPDRFPTRAELDVGVHTIHPIDHPLECAQYILSTRAKEHLVKHHHCHWLEHVAYPDMKNNLRA